MVASLPRPTALHDMSSHAEQSPYRAKPEGKSMHGRIVRELGLRILSASSRRATGCPRSWN